MNNNRSFCSDSTKPVLTLYQYEICPFCNKVKAYLDFLGVEYSVVEVNPLTKAELSFSSYRKVPVLKIGASEQINDSTEIIDYITKTFLGQKKGVSSESFLTSKDAEWNEYGDKKLAILLYPNITRNLTESYECFDYAQRVSKWSVPVRYLVQTAGCVAMRLANGKIKSKYGIQDERKELYKAVDTLVMALEASGGKYLTGKTLSLSDLQIYGVLRSIQGLTTFNEVMHDFPTVNHWYNQVQREVSQATGSSRIA